MTWVKLDDGFAEHPKVMALSDAAFRAFIRALCYCGRYDTDGRLPDGFLPPKPERELRDAGLIDVHDHGWNGIHDYLDYNPSREQVLTERRKARERRAKAGHRSGDVRANDTNPDPTRPLPDPKPAKGNSPAAVINNGGQVPDRWPYFLGKLWELDPHWRRLNIAACRRIAEDTSVAAVTTALSFAAESPPALTGSAYGWLQATAKGTLA